MAWVRFLERAEFVSGLKKVDKSSKLSAVSCSLNLSTTGSGSALVSTGASAYASTGAYTA